MQWPAVCRLGGMPILTLYGPSALGMALVLGSSANIPNRIPGTS